MSKPVVRFNQVSKRFNIGESHDSLRDLLSSTLAWLIRRGGLRNGRSTFWALDDVDFSVARGEAVGIIGPNGAGKSTALRLLAGILKPDRGSIEVRGRLAALIEVGAGFHGDLTGRENIFLNGAIMGMTRAEIRGKLDAIVDFAGIERFLDMPVKRYSSGMYARLGFSIASHVDPDILLVDEVLSVGDAVFRLRCVDRMHELVRGGTTLVFVTHNLEQMQSICPRAIVLERGKSVFAGSSRDAVAHYLKAMSRAYITCPTDVSSQQHEESQTAELLDLRFVDDAGNEVVWVRPRDTVRARLTFRLRRPMPRLVVELNMRASVNENLLSLNSGRGGITFELPAGVHGVTLTLPGLPVAGGQYFWNARMWDAEKGTTELDTPFRFPLVVDDEGRATGILCVGHQWTMEEDREARSAVSDSSSDDKSAAFPAVAGVGEES